MNVSRHHNIRAALFAASAFGALGLGQNEIVGHGLRRIRFPGRNRAIVFDEPTAQIQADHFLSRSVECKQSDAEAQPGAGGLAGEAAPEGALHVIGLHAGAVVPHGDLDAPAGDLHGHLDAIGRDRSEVRISQQCLVIIGADEHAAEAAIASAEKVFGGHLGDPRGDLAIAGSPGRVIEQIEVVNQRGEVVQEGIQAFLLKRKPA